MSSPSWIEGLGGPEEIREQVKEYAQSYIKLFNFPDNPRLLHPEDQYPYVITNSDLMCYYYILHPDYNIRQRRGVRAAPHTFPNCKKEIIENIQVATGLSNNLKNFISIDPTDYQGFLDNTSNFIHDNITDYTDVSSINKMVKLYLLCFVAKMKCDYLSSIPDILRNQVQPLVTVINEKVRLLNFTSLNLHILEYVLPKVYFMLNYLVKLFIQDNISTLVAAEILQLIKTILQNERNNIDQVKDSINVPRNHILRYFEMNRLLETLYSRINRYLHSTTISVITLAINIEQKLKQSPIKKLTSREYSTSSFKEAKYDDSKIYDKCKTIFRSTEGYFKSDIKKMKVACHKLFHPKHCGDVLKIRTDIYKYYEGEYPKIHSDDHEPLEIRLKNEGSKLIQMFEYWALVHNQEEESIFERSILYEDGFNVVIEGLRGRGEGVTKNLFTEMAKSLLTEKIFIPIEEGNKRYTINTAYKLIIDGRESKYIEHFWMYIGQFLQFCIVNGITLDFYLSHTLLYILLEKEEKLKPENVATYFIVDHNDSLTKTLVDTLNDENQINAGYYDEFNDYYPLVKRNKKISKTNFFEYVTMVAYYDVNKETFDNNDIISTIIGSFKDGFFGLKHTNFIKVLRKNKVSIQTLDRLLSESNVTLENLKKFSETTFTTDTNCIAPLLQCETAYETNTYINADGVEISQPNPKYNPEHKKIFENFKRIIASGARTFPIDLATAKSSSDSAESSGAKRRRSEEYLRFTKRLFHFWSSNSQIAFSPHTPYKVAIINRVGSLPTTHTCFYTIDIPDDLTSYKELYKKLVIAVNNVEDELGLL